MKKVGVILQVIVGIASMAVTVIVLTPLITSGLNRVVASEQGDMKPWVDPTPKLSLQITGSQAEVILASMPEMTDSVNLGGVRLIEVVGLENLTTDKSGAVGVLQGEGEVFIPSVAGMPTADWRATNEQYFTGMLFICSSGRKVLHVFRGKNAGDGDVEPKTPTNSSPVEDLGEVTVLGSFSSTEKEVFPGTISSDSGFSYLGKGTFNRGLSDNDFTIVDRTEARVEYRGQEHKAFFRSPGVSPQFEAEVWERKSDGAWFVYRVRENRA